MTIFRSKTFVRRSDIQTIWADCNEPDAIGFEAAHRGKELFSIYFEESGTRSIGFSLPPDVEFDAMEFRTLINEAMTKLEEWDAELRSNDGPWSEEVMRKLR